MRSRRRRSRFSPSTFPSSSASTSAAHRARREVPAGRAIPACGVRQPRRDHAQRSERDSTSSTAPRRRSTGRFTKLGQFAADPQVRLGLNGLAELRRNDQPAAEVHHAGADDLQLLRTVRAQHRFCRQLARRRYCMAAVRTRRRLAEPDSASERRSRARQTASPAFAERERLAATTGQLPPVQPVPDHRPEQCLRRRKRSHARARRTPGTRTLSEAGRRSTQPGDIKSGETTEDTRGRRDPSRCAQNDAPPRNRTRACPCARPGSSGSS